MLLLAFRVLGTVIFVSLAALGLNIIRTAPTDEHLGTAFFMVPVVILSTLMAHHMLAF